jgi:hypothetical protein
MLEIKGSTSDSEKTLGNVNDNDDLWGSKNLLALHSI